MPMCLGCLGEGGHDLRDGDALLGEFLPPAVVEEIKRLRGDDWMGFATCDECDGTGVISDERYRDMMASARATIDQIAARVAEEGL